MPSDQASAKSRISSGPSAAGRPDRPGAERPDDPLAADVAEGAAGAAVRDGAGNVPGVEMLVLDRHAGSAKSRPNEAARKAKPKSGSRRAGGAGPRYGQLTVCWAASEEEALRSGLAWWPNAALNGELSQELPCRATSSRRPRTSTRRRSRGDRLQAGRRPPAAADLRVRRRGLRPRLPAPGRPRPGWVLPFRRARAPRPRLRQGQTPGPVPARATRARPGRGLALPEALERAVRDLLADPAPRRSGRSRRRPRPPDSRPRRSAPCGPTSPSPAIARSRWWSSCTNVSPQPMM